LAVADHIKRDHPERPTILVSKDINLRMKAKSLGIMSEDYENDKIKDPQVFEKSITEIENYQDPLIDKLYDEGSFPVADSGFGKKPDPNEYYILKGNKSSVLARFDGISNRVVRVKEGGLRH
jgi:PhoH-like ATPase